MWCVCVCVSVKHAKLSELTLFMVLRSEFATKLGKCSTVLTVLHG